MWSQLIKTSGVLSFNVLNNSLRNVTRNFSIISSLVNKQPLAAQSWTCQNILQPCTVMLTAQRGMKQVGNCKKRCKDCYFVVRNERLFVMCKTHPRHKQMAMKKRVHNTWILTDATQSEKRAW